MIRGVLRRDGARSRPFVSASLAIPSLQLSADTAFLVDTGADGTLLAPHDAALLGVDIALLPPGPPSTGVGGAVRTVQTAATITLGPETYNLTLRILAPVTRATHRSGSHSVVPRSRYPCPLCALLRPPRGTRPPPRSRWLQRCAATCSDTAFARTPSRSN